MPQLPNLFGSIGHELGGMADDLRDAITHPNEDLVTLNVAKPYCAPARPIIRKALEPYGVKVFSIRETVVQISLADFARRMKIETKTFENLKFGPAAALFLPMAIHAKVKVRRRAAGWAEYLMLRTARLYVPGKYYEPQNEEWALKHGGTMPPQWERGEPWIEAMCSKGVNQWQQVKDAAKKAEKAKPVTVKDKLLRSLR